MPIKYGAMIRQTGGKLLRKALRILFTGRLPKLPTVNLVLVKLTLRQNCLTEKAHTSNGRVTNPPVRKRCGSIRGCRIKL